MQNILKFENFIKDFTNEGDYREFRYGDKIYAFCGNKKHSFFCIEYLGKIIFHKNYKSPKELLENIRIEDKALQEIWDALILCD